MWPLCRAVSSIRCMSTHRSVTGTATVHGDVTAFVFLIVLFAAGAVVTALLYPRRHGIPKDEIISRMGGSP